MKRLMIFNNFTTGMQDFLGMPKDFYDGYNEGIHEIFIYNIVK